MNELDDKTAWVRITTKSARDLRAIIKAGITLRVQTGTTIEDDVELKLFVKRDLFAGELNAQGAFELERPPKLERKQ